MNAQRLRSLARRHSAGHPPRPCRHDQAGPCDASLLAAEVARQRAWADFASDLLDAHIWGFRSGDWQAADALAHSLEGSDRPPDWRRDPDDASRVIVDPAVWPVGRANAR